jgi:hypothetical protein
MGFLRRSSEPAAPPREAWTLAEGQHDGRPLVLRFNEGAGEAERSAWPLRVGVAVPFVDATPEGLPGPADDQALAEIEDALTRYTEGGAVIPALVVTTSGMREFVFYARDERSARELAEAATSAAGRHEVQHYVAPDKRWDGYEEFRP